MAHAHHNQRDHSAHRSGPAQNGGHTGHGGGHAAHAGQYRNRFWVTFILALPIVALSESIQGWLNYSIPDFAGDMFIAPVLGAVVFFYGGAPFLRGALNEARSRRPGMMTLISLAIVVAFAASAVHTVTGAGMDFWWELSTLVVIMLLGHWQEMRALGQARGALEALAELLPDEAERVTPDGTETVAVHQLRAGDIVLVRPGGRVPADGVVTEGRADFDESVITGESQPVARSEGDRVVAGAVAAGSSVRIRVDALGDETALAGIHRLIAEAQQSRSRAQALADRAAALLFYVAIAAGAATLAVWSLVGEPNRALLQTVAVLVIACPHALGLAIPLVVALSTGLAARAGILVKDTLSLERMRLVDTVLFDKTGTLTMGAHRVSDVAEANGDTEGLLRLAAAVEADSEHPLARAIVRAAAEHGSIPAARDFDSLAGRGVQAVVDGRQIAVGGPALLRELNITQPDWLASKADAWRARGAAIISVVRDGAVMGAIALEDEVRPESREAVARLQESGIRVAMLTGDARQVADAVAQELGIDEVFAEVLPGDKDGAVRRLQDEGRVVAMVGDGVNDAPALARADVGIAIGAGTDVAVGSAGIVLASDDPRAVLAVVRLSRASYRKMRQNLVWAAGYNVAAIPLAAGVLAPIGLVLPPAIGAVLMSVSTIVVALNAQLLRRTNLRETDRGHEHESSDEHRTGDKGTHEWPRAA